MEGDTKKALDSIKAKTLILLGTKDLLNPEWEPREAAGSIRDAKVVTIRPESVTGQAAPGCTPIVEQCPRLPQGGRLPHRLRTGSATALLASPSSMALAGADCRDQKRDSWIKPPKTEQGVGARPTNTAPARMAHSTFCVPSP
jgi:hypothetical protein